MIIQIIDDTRLVIKCHKVIYSCISLEQLSVAVKFIGRSSDLINHISLSELHQDVAAVQLKILELNRLEGES